MTPFQKTVKYCALALAVLLALGIIGGIISLLDLFAKNRRSGNEVSENNIKTYDVGGSVTELDIEVNAAKLRITEGEEFKVESNCEGLSVKNDNGVLKVSEPKDRRVFNLSFSDTKSPVLTVFVPSLTEFRKVSVTAGAGDVSIKTLSAQELCLELGAGNLDAQGLTASEKSKINGGAGNIKIRESNLAELDMDMGVGNLNFVGSLAGSNKINCGVGKCDLTLLGEKKDYQIEADSGVGKITVDGSKVGGDTVFGEGKNKIKIDGGVGNTSVKFE